MYYCRFISIVASWLLFFFLVTSQTFDDLLWDPNSMLESGELTATIETPPSTVDDLGSGLDFPISDDLGSGLEFPISDDPANLISFNIGDDEDQINFANTASQGSCAAAAEDDATSEFAMLEARDGPSCPPGRPKKSSPAVLSPESIQLFQDPNTSINNLVSNKKKRPTSGSSGSGGPPDDPFYIPLLTLEEAEQKFNNEEEELEWNFDKMKQFYPDGTFFCGDRMRQVPVCCGGPFQQMFLRDCDPCKMSSFDQIPLCIILYL